MSDRSPMPPDAPAVSAAPPRTLVPGVHVIEDRRIPLVPNIGIVEGRDAVLVVDCGMGPVNGDTVLASARKIAGDRPLILTLTHFHPEHGFGAQAFKGHAHIFYNAGQRDELVSRGPGYLDMFRSFGPGVSAALDGVEIVMPDAVYDGPLHRIDLGGRVVELRTWGLAHTAADQIVWLPADRILFTGDLAEERIFPIFPWFPPDDAVLDAARWRSILTDLQVLDPAIVVPGHGSVGGAEILRAVAGYMDEVAQLVRDATSAGVAGTDLVARLAPVIRAAHPDWEAPEWIDFAIRYYAGQ
ncbi:MBL fold metallo-hydrolase [Gemmobacter sp.]|uniref:MBL fold metallo-hydrolase n=1 Tax=Gemmobacter sp. TaxID=1898957 RepID=UPI002AFF9A66|nr:MBL fold metallo-hydrolase [Gemmobacter sp.]